MKFLILSMAFFFSPQLFAHNLVDVEALNQSLQKSKAGWVAKHNSMNQMSRKEARHFLGLANTPAEDVEFSSNQMESLETLPQSIDWRNKGGKNWVSPILNQASCGSCVAFAAIATLETQINISSGFSNLNVRLSPQSLFSCGGGSCEIGWLPSAAVSHLMKVGVPDEACMPYTAGATGEDVACEARCQNSEKRSLKIANYITPSRSFFNRNAVKKALLKGPLITTLTVYEDFLVYSGGVYKHKSGNRMGGHAVSIVGYDDASQSYLIRNSWGTEWGEKGFARIAYSDSSGIGNSTWGLDVPAQTGAVSVLNPRDYAYFTGNTELKVSSSYSNTDSLVISVFDSQNKALWSATCLGRNCSSPLDTRQLADGRYEVQATALSSRGDQIDSSARQFFYVANQAPRLSVSFSSPDEDLKSPLKGRVEFEIKSASSSVPMSSMEFHFKNTMTGVEVVRTAEVVLEKINMGWRTNLVANGTYEIWFVGKLATNQLNLSAESEHLLVTTKN